MKKILSAKTSVELTREDISELAEVYSKILSLQDSIGVEEDRFFDNSQVRSALFRCYNHVEAARKSIAKYCENIYE